MKAESNSTILQFFWLTQLFYTLCNGMNKLAFLTLYFRVFPTKAFRHICLLMIGISIVWTISYFFIAIFQCNPVPRVYNRAIPGTCIDFAWHRYVHNPLQQQNFTNVKDSWSNAISNLLTDLSIFFLPLPLIMKLNMSIGNRIGLVFLFSIGFFICLITMLRMATLPLTLKTREPTWESAPTNLWSFIEAAVGVICACLISLRRTISKFWPKRWRSTKGSSAGAYGAYSGRGSQPLSGRNKNMSSFHMEALKGGTKHSAKTETNVTIISRSESQERMIEGITVTKDVQVSRN